MKRNITKLEYDRLSRFQDCLDTKNIPLENIIQAFQYWLVISPTNGTAYTEFDSKRVISHLILIPKDDIEEFICLQDDPQHEFLRIMSKYMSQGYSINCKALKDRSVKKLHYHLINFG